MYEHSKNNKLAQALLLAIGSVAATGTFAVEPQPIQAGAFDVTPTLKTDIKHTDNMFLNATDEVSSNIVIVSPRVEAVADNGNSSLTLVGQVDEANFSATEEDDYTDWLVSAAGHLGLAGNQSLDLNASFFRTREMRGTGFSQGGFLPTQPDRYEDTRFGATYTLGTNQSFGRLVLGASSYDKSYRNNRATTQFRDREDMDWVGTFYFNLSDRTALLAEYRDRTVDYGTDPLAVAGAPDSLDSDETYMYVGATWEATAKTTGSVRFGQGDKEFDDADRGDGDATSWEANLRWEPLTYSTVSLTASRKFDEAVGVGNGVLARNYMLNWEHNWTTLLKSTVVLSTTDQEHFGSTRNDSMDMWSVRLDYSVARWFDVYALASYDDRASNFFNFNYEQNLFAVGFNASL